VAPQVRRTRVEPAEQVEGRDRAPRARALGAVERDHHARAVVMLGDPRRDDPDHAGMPAVAGEHVRRRRARVGDLRLGLEQDAGLGVAALGVSTRRARRRSRPARPSSSVSSSSSPASARYSGPPR
jgi:hypothetical protein